MARLEVGKTYRSLEDYPECIGLKKGDVFTVTQEQEASVYGCVREFWTEDSDIDKSWFYDPILEWWEEVSNE